MVIHIKANAQMINGTEEIRQFELSSNGYSGLVRDILSFFTQDNVNIKTFWTDGDGSLIIFSSDKEFEEVLKSIAPDQIILPIHVVFTDKSSNLDEEEACVGARKNSSEIPRGNSDFWSRRNPNGHPASFGFIPHHRATFIGGGSRAFGRNYGGAFGRRGRQFENCFRGPFGRGGHGMFGGNCGGSQDMSFPCPFLPDTSFDLRGACHRRMRRGGYPNRFAGHHRMRPFVAC